MGSNPHVSTRRAMLAGLIAAPIAAAPGLATLAGPSDDADLIRTCEAALQRWDAVDERCRAEDWSAARLTAECDSISVLIAAVIAMPALTPAGVRAKAQLVASQTEAFASDDPDQNERLVRSLLRDLGAGPVQREASAVQ